ncbi:hypothetical protein D1AOALGA4SA_1475 [Olavius algarvensis Delta 1 endosymbiont]|nr:hypothetical protein D1AOALGA4SA_1475 [Olavius algarvensis Delta 1 endosymbiont]
MFAQDLCYRRIDYFRTTVELNIKLERQSIAIQQIFNLKYSIPACPG